MPQVRFAQLLLLLVAECFADAVLNLDQCGAATLRHFGNDESPVQGERLGHAAHGQGEDRLRQVGGAVEGRIGQPPDLAGMHAVIRVGGELATCFRKVLTLRQKRLHLTRLFPARHKNLHSSDLFSPPRPRVGFFDIVLRHRDFGHNVAPQHRVGESLGFALGKFG